jgi:hypothetical protein
MPLSLASLLLPICGIIGEKPSGQFLGLIVMSH